MFMTVNQAIKQSRKDVKENATYNADKDMWQITSSPAGSDKRIWLRNRRIIYALMLLGVDEMTAEDETDQPGRFVEIVYNYFK
jgi:hypothetical protein